MGDTLTLTLTLTLWGNKANVLVPFGDDFKFQASEIQFRNMDMVPLLIYI